MIQHKAAKFATNIYPKRGHYDTFSISRLLNDLNWSTLQQRRNQARLGMIYKIINNMVILDPSSLPKSSSNRTTRQCNEAMVGPANKLIEQHSRLDVTGKTFFYSAAKLWNQQVTTAQANASSFDAFKQHFKNSL